MILPMILNSEDSLNNIENIENNKENIKPADSIKKEKKKKGFFSSVMTI